MPGYINKKEVISSDESTDLSDSDSGNTQRNKRELRKSRQLTNYVPQEPITSDEDSDDSDGEGRFSRVFVVNPDSSSDLENSKDSDADSDKSGDEVVNEKQTVKNKDGV